MALDSTQSDGFGVVRYETERVKGLWKQAIYGLNVFAANERASEAPEDPRYRFVKQLAQRSDAFIHIDCWMRDELRTPADDFVATFPSRESRRIGIGVSQGSFYELAHEAERAIIAPWTRDLADRLDADDMLEAMEDDAVCVYIGVKWDRRDEFLRMCESPFPGSDGWIRQVTELCDCLVISIYDAWGFIAYAKDRQSFLTLGAAIDSSAQLILDSNWYIQNHARLYWEDEEDKCLKPIITR